MEANRSTRPGWSELRHDRERAVAPSETCGGRRPVPRNPAQSEPKRERVGPSIACSMQAGNGERRRYAATVSQFPLGPLFLPARCFIRIPFASGTASEEFKGMFPPLPRRSDPPGRAATPDATVTDRELAAGPSRSSRAGARIEACACGPSRSDRCRRAPPGRRRTRSPSRRAISATR